LAFYILSLIRIIMVMRHLVGWLVIFSGALGYSGDFFVSVKGNDSNNGRSVKSPWRSINQALERVVAGDSVYVLGGVYEEVLEIRKSGTDGKPVSLLAYQDQTPILDGSNIEVKAQTAFVNFEDVRHFVMRGFEIRNLKSDAKKCVPIGILVSGVCHHIEIRNNRIHAIETNFDEKNGGDAHGIAVFGNQEEPIHHIAIDGNELFNLKLGSSEALVLNGNVKEFAVTNNKVHDCNNIALDFIGFEKICPKPELDQVRDGICVGNTVYNIDSAGNPAYGDSRSAGGIYVDGGTKIIIEKNRIWNCNIGIELASEHKGRSTSYITVRNNLIFKNQIGGIFIGGYNKKKGLTEHCEFTNNTLYQNDDLQDGNGEFYLQFGTANNTLTNNIFVTNSQDLFIANPYVENENNVIDRNLYFCSDGEEAAEFQWKKVKYKGWAAWQASGNDQQSSFAEPIFANPDKGDFTLSPDSPCLKGKAAFKRK
jgi:Protein of unknown function (DUF1565)